VIRRNAVLLRAKLDHPIPCPHCGNEIPICDPPTESQGGSSLPSRFWAGGSPLLLLGLFLVAVLAVLGGVALVFFFPVVLGW
jgi:hypothetical protein